VKNGTVSQYFDDFGIGFIAPDEPGKSVLFTDRVVVGRATLNAGALVEYELYAQIKDKPEAKRVRPI